MIFLNIAADVCLVDLFYNTRYSYTRMQNPDFVKLAEAMNVKALRCRTADSEDSELPVRMKEFFFENDNSKPILLECFADQTEHGF